MSNARAHKGHNRQHKKQLESEHAYIRIQEVASFFEAYGKTSLDWNDAMCALNGYFMHSKISKTSILREVRELTGYRLEFVGEPDCYYGLADCKTLCDLTAIKFKDTGNLKDLTPLYCLLLDELIYGSRAPHVKEEVHDYLAEQNVEIQLSTVRGRLKYRMPSTRYSCEFIGHAESGKGAGKLLLQKIIKPPSTSQMKNIEQKYPPLVVSDVSEIPANYPPYAIGSCFIDNDSGNLGTLQLREVGVLVPKHVKKYQDMDEKELRHRIADESTRWNNKVKKDNSRHSYSFQRSPKRQKNIDARSLLMNG